MSGLRFAFQSIKWGLRGSVATRANSGSQNRRKTRKKKGPERMATIPPGFLSFCLSAALSFPSLFSVFFCVFRGPPFPRPLQESLAIQGMLIAANNFCKMTYVSRPGLPTWRFHSQFKERRVDASRPEKACSAGSQPLPDRYPADTQPIPNRYPTDTQPIPNRYPTDTQPTPNRHPTAPQPTPNRHPTDTQSVAQVVPFYAFHRTVVSDKSPYPVFIKYFVSFCLRRCILLLSSVDGSRRSEKFQQGISSGGKPLQIRFETESDRMNSIVAEKRDKQS
jgi:hypothetical protein